MSSDWNQKLCRRNRTCLLWARCVTAVTVLGFIAVAAAYTWPETWKMWMIPVGIVWVTAFIGWIATVPHSHVD